MGHGISRGFIFTLSTILLVSSLVMLAYQFSLDSNARSLSMRSIYPAETVSFAYDDMASNLRAMSLNPSYLSIQPNGTTWAYNHGNSTEFFSHAASGNFTLNCSGGFSQAASANLSQAAAYANYSAYFTGRFSNLTHAESSLGYNAAQFGPGMAYFCMDNMSVPTNYLGNGIRYYSNQSLPGVERHYFVFPPAIQAYSQSVRVDCPQGLSSQTHYLSNSSCGLSCVAFNATISAGGSTAYQQAVSSYASAPYASFLLSSGGTVDVEFSSAWGGSNGVRVTFTNAPGCSYLVRTGISDAGGLYSAYRKSPFAPVPALALNFTLFGASRNSTAGGYG
ncbi:MAG: hypothetical protein WC506_03525 [Candidatus Micrarchaeia archaeon]